MPAKTYHWTGEDATPNIENPVGNNWREEDGTAAGAGVFPGSAQADNVIFDGRALAAPALNLNQDDSAFGILDLTVGEGYRFGIGAIDAPLVWKIAAGSPVWRFESDEHGALYIVATTAAIAEVHVVRTPDDENSALSLLAADAAITLMNITGGRVNLPATMAGETSAGVATMNVDVRPDAPIPVVRSWAAVATALNLRGGEFRWNQGTLTQLNNYGGTLACKESVLARTMTNGTQYDGLTDLRTGEVGKITLTNPFQYKGGGHPLFDIGTLLQSS